MSVSPDFAAEVAEFLAGQRALLRQAGAAFVAGIEALEAMADRLARMRAEQAAAASPRFDPTDRALHPALRSLPPEAAEPEPAPMAEAGESPAPEDDEGPPLPEDFSPTAQITAQRARLFMKLWPNRAASARQILRALNELPGARIADKAGGQMAYYFAKVLRLPTARGDAYGWPGGAFVPPEAPPAPASQDDVGIPISAAPEAQPGEPAPAPPPVLHPPVNNRTREDSRRAGAFSNADAVQREAEECFAAGMGPRTVADQMRLPLSSVSNWHADWRRAQQPRG